jgi:hypothetical protein
MSFNRSSFFALVCVIAALPLAATTRAALPESEVKLAGAIPLTTELLEKMEKFLTNLKSDAAAKSELAAVTNENKDNPPMTGEAWGSLITAKCPKTVAVFQATGLTPEEFGKAAHAIESIIMCETAAPPGDPDNLAKSQDKTVAANDAFYLANKARCDVVYGNFGIFGLQ